MKNKNIMEILHYVLLTIALGMYHFYIGMPILELMYGFWIYWAGFFIVLVVIDKILHKTFGLD